MKNEEERKREIQVMKQIARANEYQSEKLERVIRENVGKKKQAQHDRGKIFRSCTIVIKAFKKLNINVGISNDAAMVRRIRNDHTEKREKAN